MKRVLEKYLNSIFIPIGVFIFFVCSWAVVIEVYGNTKIFFTLLDPIMTVTGVFLTLGVLVAAFYQAKTRQNLKSVISLILIFVLWMAIGYIAQRPRPGKLQQVGHVE